jgi:FkbM family methyltransferase
MKSRDTQGALEIEVVIDQAGERMSARRHSIDLPDGRQLAICIAVDETDDISTTIARGSYGIPAHYRLLEALLPRPGRVVDLGAHIGTFSLYAAALGHEVVAVDASRRNMALLRASVGINGFDGVHPIHAAVSDAPGFLEFTEFGAYGVVATPRLNWPTVRVPSITLDGLLASLGWRDADFIKMDVEGSEIAALRGMQRLTSTSDVPIVFESNGHTLHLYDQDPEALLQHLRRDGYRSWEIQGRRLIPVQPDAPQLACVVDYVALKRPDERIEGWLFDPPRSPEKEIDVAIAAARDGNPHVRAHVGRTLRRAKATLIADDRVDAALRDLLQDSELEVRKSVAWFSAGNRAA